MPLVRKLYTPGELSPIPYRQAPPDYAMECSKAYDPGNDKNPSGWKYAKQQAHARYQSWRRARLRPSRIILEASPGLQGYRLPNKLC